MEMTTSAIQSASETVAAPLEHLPTVETDSIPRIKVRDFMLGLQFLGRNPDATLDALRVKLNSDRNAFSSRTAGYSIARDVASELARLQCADVGPLPKDSKGFEKKRNTRLRLTELGQNLAQTLRKNRGDAYVAVLKAFFTEHPYMRRYIAALARGPLIVPVITSAKQHISERYAAAKTLAEDVAGDIFDPAALVQSIERRLGRALASDETTEIEQGIAALLVRLAPAARTEPQTDFARKMLMAVNEIVVPAVLRREGIHFDYNSFRRLLQMGEEFQVSWATSAHPRYYGWLVFSTATLALDAKEESIDSIRFDNGLVKLRNDFLDRLYEAYQRMQQWGLGTTVTAWELRATFCFEHRCAPGVFDVLFAENYGGSDTYIISKDFPRNKPSHEQSLVVGGRQIGLIRIARR